MDFIKNLKILFFTIIVILWSDVFNAGSYSSQTSDTSIADDGSRLTESRELLHPTPTKKPTRKPTRKPKTLRPLPQKDDTFLRIRRGKKVFIDKTPYIAELLKDGRSCILFTRPRRFGKSNFLQMLHSFFSGQKELFKGTKIYSRGNTDKKGEWVEYPVVNLTFSRIAKYGKKVPSAELFETRLYDTLQDIADFYKVDCDENLDTLVKNLRKKFCLPVVILIDEYDYPFTSILHKRPDGSLTTEETNMLQGMKTTLEQFFGTIKDLIEANEVRLAFVTGVARLAFEGLPGSGPNNVVTLTDKYSCMVGFTIDEISRYLGPHIDHFAKVENTTPEEITKKLLKIYGGYLFSDTRKTEVLNPVSVMACLENQRFGNYWCATHSINIVIGKMLADGIAPSSLRNIEEPETSFFERNPTHNAIPTTIYMLVYGYLSVRKYDKETAMVTLDYPNDEIEETLINHYNLRLMLECPTEVGKDGGLIVQSLKLKDLKWHTKLMNKLGFRNNVPAGYQIEMKDEFTPTTIMYTIFKTIGIRSILDSDMYENAQRKQIRGDLDLMIVIGETCYIFESKFGKEEVIIGIGQLLDYVINEEKAFLDTVYRRFTGGTQPTEFYLISLNFMKENNDGKICFINSFVGIPFRATDPKDTSQDATAAAAERMKIWFRDMKVSNDKYKGILETKYGCLPVDRAVW